MIKFVIIMETKSSSRTDWMYVKSVLDFYYVPRTYSNSPIFSKSKTELIRQDRKIAEIKKINPKETKIIIVADYDREENVNLEIEKYCTKQNYDLVWMNLDVEDVFLGNQINPREKAKQAERFQI